MEEKKPKCSDQNFLLDFPEDILHRILSYLPMKDVIKTSAVTKRWRYVWLYVPCLNFAHLLMPPTKLIAFINRSLVLHKALEIQKLSISLAKKRLDSSEAYDVQSWILFAATRNVKELYFSFYGPYKVVLPHCIFSCGSLTVLELSGCFISTPAEYKLTSLRSLTLERISHGWAHANSIVASSPKVEHLSLINCLWESSEKIELSIMNAGVKTLNIAEYVSETPDIKVNAPFVVSFDLLTSLSKRNIVLTRMKSVESITLDFSSCDVRNNILKILYNVRSVKALKLSRSGFEAISEIDERNLCLLSFKFTHLELSTEGLSKAQQGRIASVLKLSPKIRTLVITIEGFKKTVTIPDGGHLKLKDPDVLQNLETVKIYGFMKDVKLSRSKKITAEELFGQSEDDLSFLEVLLKNSKALKRMTIKICEHLRISEWKLTKLRLLVKERLLASPKASSVGISLSIE